MTTSTWRSPPSSLIAAVLVELKSRRLLPGRSDIDLDEELALWRNATSCSAASSSARRSRTRRPSCCDDEPGRTVATARAGLEEQFIGLVPDLLVGVSPERLRDACLAALTPKLAPHVDSTTLRRSARQCATRSRN